MVNNSPISAKDANQLYLKNREVWVLEDIFRDIRLKSENGEPELVTNYELTSQQTIKLTSLGFDVTRQKAYFTIISWEIIE